VRPWLDGGDLNGHPKNVKPFTDYGFVPVAWHREIRGASHISKIIVKPCAGNLHARFERGS
jgi:hypothetical protein